MSRSPSGVAIAIGLAALVACGGARVQGPPITLGLTALDGGTLDVAGLRGRVVVLHLFDTGGVGAIADAAILADLERRDGRGVTVVGVALDPSGYPVVAPWRRALHLTYLVTLADPSVVRGESALGVLRTLPTTLVLDRRGRVVHRIEGQLARGQLEPLIAPLR